MDAAEKHESSRTFGESDWFKPDTCMYCGSRQLQPWLRGIHDRLGYVQGTWEYLRCAQCGSALLSPMPRQEIIGELYPPVYSFRPDFIKDGLFKKIVSFLEERTFYRLVHMREVNSVKHFTGVTGGELLDVGCGTGDRLARFADGGFHVRGIDIQPEVIEYIRAKYGFEVDAGTLDSVEYPAHSFDIVTICWVIEHLLEVKPVLDKIYAMLKPNGWIVAEVPLADSLQSTLLGERWCSYQEAPRHIGIPTRDGIKNLMEACGYRDVQILPTGIFNASAHFALSVIPSATASHAYTNTSIFTHLPRLLAGLLTFLHLPVALIESYLLHKPAMGVVIGRKPPSAKEG